MSFVFNCCVSVANYFCLYWIFTCVLYLYANFCSTFVLLNPQQANIFLILDT